MGHFGDLVDDSLAAAQNPSKAYPIDEGHPDPPTRVLSRRVRSASRACTVLSAPAISVSGCWRALR